MIPGIHINFWIVTILVMNDIYLLTTYVWKISLSKSNSFIDSINEAKIQPWQILYELGPTIEPWHHTHDIMIDSKVIKLHTNFRCIINWGRDLIQYWLSNIRWHAAAGCLELVWAYCLTANTYYLNWTN